MPVPLSEEEFKKALPAKCKKSVSPQIIASINSAMSDPETYESYRENLLGYANVMADGKFQVSKYIDAVKYVSFKLMGKTNIAAYSATFPEKIVRFEGQGLEQKDVASYVTAYNKSKLVALLYEQTLIPAWVLNQDLHQSALNVQAELMLSARSEKVRSDAANSLLTHLKQPESQKVELSVHQSEDSSIQALRDATLALAAQQRMAIESGQMTAQEIAHKPVLLVQEEA